jgi:hypothetical protein
MRLIDLDPRWYTRQFNNQGYEPTEIIGFTFDCPHCKDERLSVLVKSDGIDKARFIWNVSGDSFSNLTITPSIDASNTGHWHGCITNGVLS